MRLRATLLAALAALLLSVPASQASIISFNVVLTGAAEDPPNGSPGSGFATINIDDVADTMQLDVVFDDLTTNTVASHIHCCTALAGTGTAGVATVTPSFTDFPLGVTGGVYSHIFDLTSAGSYNPAFVTANGGTPAGAEAALLAGMKAGEAYLNIHTDQFPRGEIRGFLQPVPEPTTLLLLGGGLSAAALRSRRRRA
jgi:hypothetical protein